LPTGEEIQELLKTYQTNLKQAQLEEESADIEKEDEDDDDLDARTPDISECVDDQED
jgi:hypothetical protein